jgi:DNA-binding HxlR family transcriptional regulator
MRETEAAVKKARRQHLVAAAKPPPAREPNPYRANCPTRLVLDRIGDKWAFLALILIRDQPMRFNEARRAIEGVTQKMLSQTLKRLERDGLISRTVLPTAPISVRYEITPLGRTLAATLDALHRWACDHLGEVARAQERYDAL